MACKISQKCSKANLVAMQPKAESLYCERNDLECICRQDSSLLDNRYFDSTCLYAECTDTEPRKAFLVEFSSSCAKSANSLHKIPGKWAQYLAAHEITGLQQRGSSGAYMSSASPTWTLISSLKPSTLSSTRTSSKAATMSSSIPGPSSSELIQYMKPICAITDECLLNKTRNDPCQRENLQCVCKFSNSIENSTYFDQICLWNTCLNDMGKTDWMGAFARACTDVNIPLVDISERWKSYIPTWYESSSTTSTLPVATNGTSSSAIAAANDSNPVLHSGAIAGIALGVLVVVLLFLGLGCWAWRNHKSAKRKEREKATLADAMHPNGVQARIDEIKYGTSAASSIVPSFIERNNSPIQPVSRQHAYDNKIPRRGDEYYGSMRSRNGTLSGPNYNPTAPMDDEHYTPTPLSLRITKSPVSLGTPAVQHDHYVAFKPTSPDHGGTIGRTFSQRPRPRASQDSMGTTAVTSSPVKRYNFDPYGRAEYDEFGQKITYR